MNISHTAFIQAAVSNTHNLALAAESNGGEQIFDQQGAGANDIC